MKHRKIANRHRIQKSDSKIRKHVPYGPYEAVFKRKFDFVCAVLAIVCFSWLYILIAILVRVKLGSPILFIQERPGINGEIFKLYKFRTMNEKTDEAGRLLPDDKRLTEFGRLLRSLSLDELPEVINILRGEMSVVGPRPLLPEYLPRYNAVQARRHEVLPGITGLAQVHGRNAISWEKKFIYDVEYVDHITFLGDLKIIFETLKTAVMREGISSGNCATMEKFMGSGGKDDTGRKNR